MQANASRRLSPCAVARQLGVRDATVYQWIRTGELPAANLAVRIGGRPRFKIDPADLAEFLARRQTASVALPKPIRRQRQPGHVIAFY